VSLTVFIFRSPASKAPFVWRGTWRRTLLNLTEANEVHIALPNLFSDALYRPFHMSQVPLEPFVSKIPLQNQILRFTDLTAEEFNTKYSSTPFVLTSPVKQWPGFKEWTYKTLVSKYGDIKFRAESVDWRLRDYVAYMEDQSDESPLYLFDRAFVEKTNGEMEAGFIVPECFGKDFFEVLGDDRPDRRWMILGPERSGSTFHKVGAAPHIVSPPYTEKAGPQRDLGMERCHRGRKVLDHVPARLAAARRVRLRGPERGHQSAQYRGVAGRLPQDRTAHARVCRGHLQGGRDPARSFWYFLPAIQ
jgi:hypothetical protein